MRKSKGKNPSKLSKEAGQKIKSEKLPKQAKILSRQPDEVRYQELFKSMTEGFALCEIICDKKGKPCDFRYLETNPAFEQLTGLKRKNVIGRTVREIIPNIESSWIEIYGKVALTGKSAQFDSRVGTLNKDYEVFAYSPALRQFAALFTDITARKKKERELGQLNRTLKALTKSSQAMMKAIDEQVYLDAVCKIIVEDCGHKMVWIGYAENDEHKSVRPVAYSGFEEGYLEKLKISWADVERGRGPTGTAIRTGKVSMCRNMLTDTKFAPWRKEAIKRGYASSIVLPLKNVYKVFGALSIYSKEADPFSEDEVKLLSELANDLAFGITAIRLRESEKQAQKQLEAGNQELQAANEEMEATAEELQATNEELTTSNEELRAVQETLAAQNAIEDGINRILRKSMTCRTEEELGRTCLITAEQLTQSKFGFMGEINAEGRLDDIAISDPGWEACKMAIPKGHTGYKTVPGGFEIHGIYGRVLLEGEGFFTNDPSSHHDSIGVPKGHPPLTAFLGVPLRQGLKVIGMIAVGNRDGGYSKTQLEALEAISAAVVQALIRFRAEQSLRKSEQQNKLLADIITSASQAVGVGYPDGRLGMVNSAFEQLTGYTADELKSIDWTTALTPANWREREKEKLKELDSTDKPVRYEKEYIRKDGTVVPIELLVHLVRDKKGQPEYYYSFITDITERKRSEEALRESQERVIKKLDSILLPEGDIGELELGDIIDIPQIQLLIDNFYALAKIPMAIIDLKGKVLVGVGWQDICTKFHRANPETCKFCIESDTQLTKGVKPGEFKLYKCKNSMWDVATPIIIGRQKVGNLFSGQFFFIDEPLDYEVFRQQARQYGFNEAEYIAALERVPRLRRDELDSAMLFFRKLADMLSKLSYSNIKLARSITERKRAEEALQKAHCELEMRIKDRTADLNRTTELAKAERQRFYDVLETLPVYICLLTPDYYMPFANRKFHEWFGYSPDKKCYEFLFNSQEPCENCETYKTLKTNQPQQWEWTGPNGRNYSIYDFPFKDTDGSQLILEMGIDITERKQAEAAIREFTQNLEKKVADRTAELRESEKHLKRSQEIAHLGSWELDLVENKLTWSDEVYRIFGLTPQEFGATYEAFLERIHPDDRATVDNAYSGSLRNNLGAYEIDHRVVRKDTGEIRWVHEKCEHFRDSTGKIIRSVGMVHDITERKRAEALLQSRMRLSEVAQQAGMDELLQSALDEAEILTGSRIGFFHFVNEDQESLTLQAWSKNTLQNMCKAEGKGQHYPISQAGVWADCFHTRAPVIHNDYASLTRKKGLPPGHAEVKRELTLPIMRGDSVIAIIGVGNKRTDYTQADIDILRDIAAPIMDMVARQNAEAALRESEQRFRTLAEAMPGIVWTAEPDGTIDYYNQRWYEYSGLPADASESAWQETIHPEDKDDLAQAWTHSVQTGAVYNIEHRIRRADGQYRWHLSRAIPLKDENGKIDKWFGMSMDIDEQKRALEELERISAELEGKNDELESIIRIASHDLRSPLVNIKGFSGELAKDIQKTREILKDVQMPHEINEKITRVFDKFVPEAVNFIQNSAESINQMLKSLTQVAKAGTVPINVRDIDMNIVLGKITEALHFKLKENAAQLEIEPLPVCRGDSEQIAHVFTNLIDNAIKYRDPTKASNIRIYGSADGDKVTYCVEDNGKGIAEEFHERIFNLFARLDPEAAKGEGLGLTIAKRIVERQGGRIWVHSDVGKGSKFFVMMPK